MRHRIPGLGMAFLLSETALVSGTILLPTLALADCGFAPPAGNDAYVCDSGTSDAGLADTGGNNALLFPPGGSGILNGDVTFGPGADGIDMRSGTITGSVDQGPGADSLIVSDGRIIGNVQQGAGIDDFQMSGGAVGSLNQGDNLDTFTMSGGRIVDAFDDGDHAVMTGGRIGRVNMKLTDNVFDMSGGTIDGNLVTGFGNDTIILSNGTIGGNVSVSGGADRVTMTGGAVGGDIRMSFGADVFEWSGGGVVYGTINLGGDNDTAALVNLTNANIGATPAISGGLGIDRLTLDNVKTGDVARFDSWEAIELGNDTDLVFDGTLTLGDSGTGTGALSIDVTSTLFGGGANGGIAAFAADRLATVTNAGRIDLTNGGSSTADTFTIAGHYAGDGGLLFVDTVLGDDASPSDKLIVDGGTASGTTGVAVVQAGGRGAATRQDGILVVEAANGATTASGAFALTGRVAAGAHEYYLFKGGISDQTAENWYLRSTLVTPPPMPEPGPAPGALEPPVVTPQPEEPEVTPPPPPSELPETPLPSEGTDAEPPADPAPPVVVTDPEPEAPPAPPPAEPADPPPAPPALPNQPAPVPSPPPSGANPPARTPPPTPGATPVDGEVVPLYRVEVPTYAAIPPVAHYLALSTLGTFHERRGEQALLRGAGTLPAAWSRAFGQQADLKWSGTVEPSVEGDLFGFQVGLDILGRETDSGHHDRFGLFFGHARMDGDLKGQALGWNDLAVGTIDASGASLGAYWTHVAPEGWYLDGVAMATWYSGDASATTGESVDIDGTGFTASIEGGYPVALTGRWTLEPQAQLIWNHLSLDDQRDGISTVSFDTDDAVTGRLGFRLLGEYRTGARIVRPYLKTNLWHDFSASDTISFGATPIVSELDGSTLEVGGGLVVELNDRLSLFATADYATNLGGEETRVFNGNIGLSIGF